LLSHTNLKRSPSIKERTKPKKTKKNPFFPPLPTQLLCCQNTLVDGKEKNFQPTTHTQKKNSLAQQQLLFSVCPDCTYYNSQQSTVVL